MHEAHFIDEDLKWRNILARSNEGKIELFWIDCPKGHLMLQGYGFKRKRLKDCATLDKLARHLCPERERRAFAVVYLRQPND